MSLTYSIDGIFDKKFTKENISSMLERGEKTFFIYRIFFDDNWRKMPSGNHLSSKIVSEKAIEYLDNPKEQQYGPMVEALHITPTGHKNALHLRIEPSANLKNIIISWYNLDTHSSAFDDGKRGINFPFYIKKFVDIYSGFGLISLEATFF